MPQTSPALPPTKKKKKTPTDHAPSSVTSVLMYRVPPIRPPLTTPAHPTTTSVLIYRMMQLLERLIVSLTQWRRKWG